MESLGDLEDIDPGITGADLTATITGRRASIDMNVEADSLNDGIRLFLANARTALHAAGCGTPNWPAYKPITTTPRVEQVDHAEQLRLVRIIGLQQLSVQDGPG